MNPLSQSWFDAAILKIEQSQTAQSAKLDQLIVLVSEINKNVQKLLPQPTGFNITETAVNK